MRNVLAWTALAFLLSAILLVPVLAMPQHSAPANFYDSVTVLVTHDAGHGSGVIYKADDNKLRVLTAKHVVVDNPEDIWVGLSNGSKLHAHVSFMHDGMDYAILDVDFLDIHTDTAAHVACRAPVIEEPVTVVGFPLSLNFIHTKGTVASLVRTKGISALVDGLVPMDVSVTFGNSGGPVFDKDGNVIGIATAIITAGQGQTGISLMSPTDTLCAALPRL